jgi:hypothetical protein
MGKKAASAGNKFRTSLALPVRRVSFFSCAFSRAPTSSWARGGGSDAAARHTGVDPPIRTPFPLCFRAQIFQSLEIEVKIHTLNLFVVLAAVFHMP